MITFKLADQKLTEGVPTVDVLDEKGRRLAVIYVEDGEMAIGVMSARLEGPFTESVKFLSGDGKEQHPTVVIQFARK